MSRPAVRLGLLLAVLGIGSGAPALENANCLGGCPAGSPAENVVVQREIYVLSASPKTRLSDWVAYRVTKEGQAAEVRMDRK